IAEQTGRSADGGGRVEFSARRRECEGLTIGPGPRRLDESGSEPEIRRGRQAAGVEPLVRTGKCRELRLLRRARRGCLPAGLEVANHEVPSSVPDDSGVRAIGWLIAWRRAPSPRRQVGSRIGAGSENGGLG